MAKILKVSFANWNHNSTAGITLTSGAGADFAMGDVLTPTGLDLAKKTATSVAAKNAATLDVGTDVVVAEPVKSGDTYIVVYITKDGDTFVVEQAGSAV